MPLFSRFKNKGSQPASKKTSDLDNGTAVLSRPARWQSRWESTTIVPEEVQELVHLCTSEMKSRAEALDAPFMLLPFRPDADPQGARTFVRNFYKANAERSTLYQGESLKQELRLTDSLVLCSVIKWCWSRMPNGVVSWPVYEGFRIGEQEARMARNAFDTFIPIGCDSDARRNIITDFYDLLAAVAAHGKMNGLGGRKLSRLAGWWAFDHSDDGKGFEGGYKSWTSAADASSHLFFAYLRALSPDTDPSMNVIERIPRSLQALAASTEYPPETPSLLQRSTPRVVMMVDTVSPTPFSLLRRAKNFEYRDRDHVLRSFSEFEDPIDALTEECKRVLYAVSSTNQSTVARSRQGITKPEESWSAFQNLGFSDIDEKALQKSPTSITSSGKTVGQGLRSEPRSRAGDAGRPTTPSWADFLSSGFADDGGAKSPTLLYPPAQVLPPLGSRSSSPGRLDGGDEGHLAPGELAAITNVELDDAFWWVWITSLASEEPSDRKAVFGRCALIETTIANGAWLIMEEQVKGASPDPTVGAYIAPKKSLFSFTKRGRLGRKRSVGKSPTSEPRPERALSATPSKTSISTDQHAKIKAAARALTSKRSTQDESDAARRGRYEDAQSTKTNSMLTLGIQSEAGPAMKWASSYDKNTIRQQYLGDSFAGKGVSREELLRKGSSNRMNGEDGSVKLASSPVPSAMSTYNPEPQSTKELPRVPEQEVVDTVAEPTLQPDEIHVPESFAPALGAKRSPYSPEQASITSHYETEPEPASAFDKETSAGAAISPVSNRVGRKPIPRNDDHPAHRQTNVPGSEPKSPTQNPAALAAQAALAKASGVSPDSKLKKQPVHGGGFKKLFGKKRDDALRGDSLDLQRPDSKGLAPPSDQGLSRRLSMMRRKKNNAAIASPRASEPHFANSPRSGSALEEPVISHGHDYPAAHMSHSSIREQEAAEREFSRFDQGPIEDMPVVAPTETDGEVSPIINDDKFDDFASNRQQHQAGAGAQSGLYDTPALRGDPANDRESEVSMDDQPDAHVNDRWATIRENAHKRAERTRQSEDQSTQQSRITDDGETSGEETIESRVARIKARVAELTGNMDGVSAHR